MASSHTRDPNPMGRNSVSVLDSFWVALPVSSILGLLSGLGTGGGSLLILWLTVVLGMDQNSARIINLMFFIPSALVASWFRRKQNHLKPGKLLPAIITGCIFAFAAVKFGGVINKTILKKVFGLLLIFTGVRELLYKNKAGQ